MASMRAPWRRCRPARSGHSTGAADQVCRYNEGRVQPGGPFAAVRPTGSPHCGSAAGGSECGRAHSQKKRGLRKPAAAHLGSEGGRLCQKKSGGCGNRLRLTWARRAARPAWPCWPRRAGPTWRPGPRRTRPPGAAAHPTLIRVPHDDAVRGRAGGARGALASWELFSCEPGSCACYPLIPVRVHAAAACGPAPLPRSPGTAPPTPHPGQHPRRTIWISTSHRSSARRPRSGRSGSGRSLCMPPKVSAAAPTRPTCAQTPPPSPRRRTRMPLLGVSRSLRTPLEVPGPRSQARAASAAESRALQPLTLGALEPALTCAQLAVRAGNALCHQAKVYAQVCIQA